MRNKRQRRFAVLALAILTAASFAVAGEQDPEQKTRKSPAGQEEASPFRATLETGIGYDSNAYQAPGAPYIDYAPYDPTTGTYVPASVNPVRHSGFFIPAVVKAKYSPTMEGGHRFVTSFRFNGDLYPSSTLSNADTYNGKLDAGFEFVFGRRDKREDTFYIGPFITYNRETYVDRDTGVEKTTRISGTNISNRYNYRGVGIEAEYKKRTTAVQYGIHAKAEQRDYDDPVVVAQYDHMYYVFGGEVEFPVARPTKLKLSYEYKVRDYDERHARDASGIYSSANPLLQYTYHDAGVTLRNRLGKRLVVYLDYDRLIRNDEHVGYNDYTEDEYRIRIVTREDRGSKLRAVVSYWKRDYPHAFAYDNATQPQKEYDGIETEVKGELALLDQWGLWAEYKYWNQDSTDLRYDYDRYQAMAGVKWEY